jgi:hypothetical protein
MHLCNLHGNIALKMYSLISYNSLRIVDTLKEHFEKAYITKPFTSKLFNYECYIIGINKLSEDFDEKSFQDSLERGMSERSVSETLIEHFERERAADKMRIANLYLKIHDKNWSQNKEYQTFLDEFKSLYEELKKV